MVCLGISHAKLDLEEKAELCGYIADSSDPWLSWIGFPETDSEMKKCICRKSGGGEAGQTVQKESDIQWDIR